MSSANKIHKYDNVSVKDTNDASQTIIHLI